jgi:hypothetical protein
MSDDAEAAELFGRWAAAQDLLGRVTEDQCAGLAQAFMAGFFYGQNPILRKVLRAAEPSITCPACGMTSRHPDDIREGYCGNCHDWTGEPTQAG